MEEHLTRSAEFPLLFFQAKHSSPFPWFMRDYVILNSNYSSAFPVKKNWSLPPPHATQSQPCCSLPPCESQFCPLIRLNTPGSTDPGPVLKRRRSNTWIGPWASLCCAFVWIFSYSFLKIMM